MKRNDIGLIIVIVIISMGLSLFISNSIFGSSKNKLQSVSVIQDISPEFSQPDTHYFNKSTFDPSVTIQINPNNNTNPFSNSAQ